MPLRITSASLPRLACLAASLCLCGCGGAVQLPTVPVTCEVTLDGEPLSQGAVVLTPLQGRQARGDIQSDGTAMLGTYDDEDGAQLGRHRIAVAVTVPDESQASTGPVPSRKWLIPRRYGSPDTSGLSVEVDNPEGHQIRIELSTTGEGRVVE